MTTFSYPLKTKGREINIPASSYSGLVPAWTGVTATFSQFTAASLSGGQSFNLFVAPSGSRLLNWFYDITTAWVGATVGTFHLIAGATAVDGGTTISNGGRLNPVRSTANVSTIAIVFTQDTTIAVRLSTSAGTIPPSAGASMVWVEIV